MFATRDTFFDDDTDQVGGAEPEQAELENAVIMPMPEPPGGESLVPGTGGGPAGGAWNTGEELLMPGSSGDRGAGQPPAGPPAGGRAAQMRRMQEQARASRGGLSGGGMRPPMGAGGMQSTNDDEFSIRPTSRGARMGSRGPLAPVNVAAGFSQPGGMAKETPVQISQTEQDLARNGIDTVFDPTTKGGPSASGSGAPGVGGIGSPTMGLAPARMDTSDIRGLLTRVPPPDTTVQCYIVRKKGAMGMFASYKLYLQESVSAGPGHMNNKFLLSARKRKKQKKSNYLISLDEEDLAKNSGNYYGKVKSNFVGTEFVMHDKGVKPADAEQAPVANLRKELGVVLYDTNVLGTKGPRKMTVIVPPVSDDGHVMATTEEGLLERVKQGEFGDCQKLHNKAPRWNESLGAYCLNFNGRVTLPSVKNFQLQLEGASDPNQVSLQFGKTGDSTFTMDYSYPLSPLQAFQIVLSSFDHKWACE